MSQLVIDPGTSPVSAENVEYLRDDNQSHLGVDHQVVLGAERRELRDGFGLSAGPYIDLLWSVGGGVITAAVLASIKAGVKRWRGRGTWHPRASCAPGYGEYDEDGQLRIVWEETREDEPD
jgi:hypothetical protein